VCYTRPGRHRGTPGPGHRGTGAEFDVIGMRLLRKRIAHPDAVMPLPAQPPESGHGYRHVCLGEAPMDAAGTGALVVAVRAAQMASPAVPGESMVYQPWPNRAPAVASIEGEARLSSTSRDLGACRRIHTDRRHQPWMYSVAAGWRSIRRSTARPPRSTASYEVKRCPG
jgi:hypothetical protein